MKAQPKTYDIQFNDNSTCNAKGFALSLDECIDYITRNNGTNESYFADYKGGSVSVVCNQTEDVVYTEEIPMDKPTESDPNEDHDNDSAYNNERESNFNKAWR